ncbi:palmitoyltransferase ZDHHC21 isoform X1 [Arapaima gigas]
MREAARAHTYTRGDPQAPPAAPFQRAVRCVSAAPAAFSRLSPRMWLEDGRRASSRFRFPVAALRGRTCLGLTCEESQGSVMKLRLHFVVDPMGWLCISMVLFIWLYNSFFIPHLVLLPHFQEGHISGLVVASYYLASLLCITALFRASTADPGRVPQNPHIPHSERDQWELCNKCNMMRPKRSHHCSRCGHCVRRMDHHCPWINNCVGEDNHWIFLQLCFYTQVLSLFTLILDFCQYYYFQPLSKVDMEEFSSRHELALLRLSTFMGLLMFGGMSSLFYTQITGILAVRNTCPHPLPFCLTLL